MIVPPNAILELAKKDPIVHAFLREWRSGSLTWEQALSGMVLYLHKENCILREAAVDLSAIKATQIVVSPERFERFQQLKEEVECIADNSLLHDTRNCPSFQSQKENP